MRIEIVACDIDEETPAKSYAITIDGETHELDLCRTHARPIEELITAAKGEAIQPPTSPPMQSAPPSPPERTTAVGTEEEPAARRRGGRRPRITSMAEVEAAKAAYRAQD
ncbi:hypothetical protein [Streptomyces caelestis]|uniref:hypothetical protein n=1 Tax=Streptomyces caelestis TaxID=36816 RepID=UPI003654680F